MRIKPYQLILFTVLGGWLMSCSPKTISSNYYAEHEKELNNIEANYKILYQEKPFTVGFTDKHFKTVLLEFITDSLTYIYEFGIDDARLTDSITKYTDHPKKVLALIAEMQAIRCTWINKYDYYVNDKKNLLTFMSIKAVPVRFPFSYRKYYILTYFSQPQYFDSNGNLLDKRKQRRLRRINGVIFKKINDKVCYTISGNFR